MEEWRMEEWRNANARKQEWKPKVLANGRMRYWEIKNGVRGTDTWERDPPHHPCTR